VWDPASFLYVSDEVQNKIYRLYLDGRKEEVIALGDPDGNTYDRHHCLLDCASVLRAIHFDHAGRPLHCFGRPLRGKKSTVRMM